MDKISGSSLQGIYIYITINTSKEKIYQNKYNKTNIPKVKVKEYYLTFIVGENNC